MPAKISGCELLREIKLNKQEGKEIASTKEQEKNCYIKIV